METQPNTNPERGSDAAGAAKLVRQQNISSLALLGPSGELTIVHGSREYRLRLTKNGKLILTA